MHKCFVVIYGTVMYPCTPLFVINWCSLIMELRELKHVGDWQQTAMDFSYIKFLLWLF